MSVNSLDPQLKTLYDLLKSDINSLMTEVKSEISSLRSDVKSDITAMNNNINVMNNSINRFNVRLESHIRFHEKFMGDTRNRLYMLENETS